MAAENRQFTSQVIQNQKLAITEWSLAPPLLGNFGG
jgi:hypothetical protein